MTPSSFPVCLRHLREAAGLTQESLALAAGLHRNSVSALESGRKNASLRTAHALARVLKCTVDELGCPPEQ
jgi:putative transcriptional regulator